ncbi:MAG: hypothetical protein ACI8RZ_005100 [Myxococcota bacterium]|jgi:hypothetical protein
MFISGVQIDGLADCPSLILTDLDRVIRVAGPDPASTALGDGIALVFAALSEPHCVALLQHWDLLGPEESADILSDPFPAQASWTDRIAARALVDDPDRRSITATLSVELDPLLFRELREQSVRHPRLITALSSGLTVRITVGALFATSFDALALSLQSVHIGTESFPTLPRERPDWLTRLLRQIGDRFHRHAPREDLAETIMAVATSREHHRRYQAWQAAMSRLGVARVARGPGGAAQILVDERPLRRFGVAGLNTAALAAAIHLNDTDILWAETADPLLEQSIDDGALEQVWWVGATDGIAVAPIPRTVRRAASFTRKMA